jgi:hypothetical protein
MYWVATAYYAVCCLGLVTGARNRHTACVVYVLRHCCSGPESSCLSHTEVTSVLVGSLTLPCQGTPWPVKPGLSRLHHKPLHRNVNVNEMRNLQLHVNDLASPHGQTDCRKHSEAGTSLATFLLLRCRLCSIMPRALQTCIMPCDMVIPLLLRIPPKPGTNPSRLRPQGTTASALCAQTPRA